MRNTNTGAGRSVFYAFLNNWLHESHEKSAAQIVCLLDPDQFLFAGDMILYFARVNRYMRII